MAHQVPWCREILEIFIEEACLSELEADIMRTRIRGWSRAKQCMEFHLSASSLDRMIAALKRKYDNVQKRDNRLPPRRSSVQETWMDEN